MSALDEQSDTKGNETSFSLSWTIGMNQNVSLLNLSVSGKTRYFYTIGNVGIIGTASGKAQIPLRGHISTIVSAAVSLDKQWLVTAESKPEVFLIIWNTYTAKPVKYLADTSDTGIIRVFISRDGKLIALLTEMPDQKIIIWQWSNQDATPIVLSTIPTICERQSWFTMIEERSIFCSVGQDSAIFFIPDKDSKHVRLEIHRNIQTQLGQRVSPVIFCYMLPGKREAVVLTSTGKAVFFEVESVNVGSNSVQRLPSIGTSTIVLPSSEPYLYMPEKLSIKRLHDLQRAITCVEWFNNHVVIGTAQSQVIVYDHDLNFLKQYPSLNVGPLLSISIDESNRPDDHDSPSIGKTWTHRLDLPEVICQSEQNIVVAHCNFALIKIVQTMPTGEITDVCLHSILPILLIGTSTGHLYGWHGQDRCLFLDKSISISNPIGITKVSLNKLCSHLAIGLQNGHLWLYDAVVYTPLNSRPWSNSSSPIQHLEFSPNSVFLSAASADRGISLYIRDDKKPNVYHYHGHCFAHADRLTAMVFHEDRGTKKQRLFSCGTDGDLIEYIIDDQRQYRFSIQMRSNLAEYPTYIHSLVIQSIESLTDYLICSMSDGRIKFFDLVTKKLCHTVRAVPSFFLKIKVWPLNCDKRSPTHYLAYHTSDCVGAMRLPGTGQLNEYDLVFAHTDGVRSFDAMPNEKLLVSYGQYDNGIFLWKFDEQLVASRDSNSPLQSSIPIEELKSLFYHVQLQDSSDLTIQPLISLPLMTDFARARGLHISERQIRELYDEQCMKKKCIDPNNIRIDFNEAVQIFYNHFAVSDVHSQSIEQTLKNIFDAYPSSKYGQIDFHKLIEALMTQGEKMTLDEIHQAFQTLGIIHEQCESIDALPNGLNREEFLQLFHLDH